MVSLAVGRKWYKWKFYPNIPIRLMCAVGLSCTVLAQCTYYAGGQTDRQTDRRSYRNYRRRYAKDISPKSRILQICRIGVY